MSIITGHPPDRCPLCNAVITKAMSVIDGKAYPTGQWTWMCTSCYLCRGVGLGLGKGQLYRWSEQHNAWVKVEDGDA